MNLFNCICVNLPECKYAVTESGVGNGCGYRSEQEVGGGIKNNIIFNTPLLMKHKADIKINYNFYVTVCKQKQREEKKSIIYRIARNIGGN